ncbi:MAG: GNAT family N-acetyltransferase [Reyranellaceae bacterium]
MLAIRPAEPADLPAVAALDARLTGHAKAAYWQGMLEQYAGGPPSRHFLVAETPRGQLAGFVVGEVRAWEFGQPAAGWVFAIQVDPQLRLQGAGSALFEALCVRFREQGVRRVRTLVDRKDNLILSFFRAQGMTAGPSLQLDKDLDGDIAEAQA